MDASLFRAFVRAVETAKTRGEIRAAGLAFARALGFVNLRLVEHGPDLSAAPVLRVTDGLHERFETDYARLNLHRADPVLRIALQRLEPFRFREDDWATGLSEGETAFLTRTRRNAADDAIIFGVYGEGGRDAVCAAGFDPLRGPPDPTRTQLFRTACQIAHSAAIRLSEEADAPLVGPGAPSLSPRESEVMHWVVRGKSNPVIGDILGCSSHTVDTHLRRIFAKLEVGDRVSAALRAVALGLSAP